MNHIMERSLCQDCTFVQTCNLTTNKSSIWSCSEYELAKIDMNKYSKNNIQKFDRVLNNPTVELI
ncbi:MULTISPECIES: hypothetical protein [unclassified Bizionia]|uniref:hypothetical protein n=1 Tax=unclassified Bizionia TaxID=2626393 RepID=UPI002060EBFA|nr:hypothetical protein [Bizionia sp. M204]UPS90773.1 hypothetical protein GMA17_03165 [Bizionia sp. M204]